MLSNLGTMSLSIPATNCIVSVASSPIVMLPPIVTLPVTSKSPVIFVLSCKLIVPLAAAKLASCVSVSTVLPLNLQSPVSTFVPSTNVVSLPVLNETPLLVLIIKSLTLNAALPVSWLT